MSNRKDGEEKQKTKKHSGMTWASFGLVVILAALLVGSLIANRDKAVLDSDIYVVEIGVQDYGVITVELDGAAAPVTVSNFLTLVTKGSYDGSTFHRIVEGFMMQGGIVKEDVKPIKGEFAANGVENSLSHTRGAISMARTPANNSATSQFFIVHQDSTFLDGQYAAFGYVVDGMDVVDAICTAAEPVDGDGSIPPADQPVIKYIKLIEEGLFPWEK